jgi:hypothetical protein
MQQDTLTPETMPVLTNWQLIREAIERLFPSTKTAVKKLKNSISPAGASGPA